MSASEEVSVDPRFSLSRSMTLGRGVGWYLRAERVVCAVGVREGRFQG